MSEINFKDANYKASNKILEFKGLNMDFYFKKGNRKLINVHVDEVLKNPVTRKPAVLYFTADAGKGRKGGINFEDLSYWIESPNESLSEVVPESMKAYTKTY